MSISYEKSNVNFIPAAPLTSRFVAPWDTSGWYYVCPNMARGAKIYSNSDVTIAEIDEKYVGADYVVTFNSISDGFDDKQEVDFFAERDITVFAAFDKKNIPAYTAEWDATGDEMKASDGTAYAIFVKDFADGAHITVPAPEGEGNHFSVFVLPKEYEAGTEPVPEAVVSDEIPTPYAKRTYKNYITEVFNGEKLAPEFYTEGKVELVARENEPQDKFALVHAGAALSRDFGGSDRMVVSAKIEASGDSVAGLTLYTEKEEALALTFSDASVAWDISEDEVELVDCGEEVNIRVLYNGEAGEAELFVNCRKAATIDCAKGALASVCFACAVGEAKIDNLVVSDFTELYVADDDFESEKSRFMAQSEGASVETVAYPFKDSKAMKVSAGVMSYAFAPLSGVCTVESLVMANSEEFCLAPMLTDASGTPAMRVALYKNNLYASDGGEFVRIFGGLCEFHYFPCQNHMNIKVTVDTEKGTYDLMVDGAYRAKGFKLMNPVKEICNAVFSGEKAGLTLMRIRVYDDVDFSRGMLPNAPVFDVTKAPYNAVGDGVTLETEKIQKAIDDAAYTGGTVLLPRGTFFTGELFLRSDMTLWVDRDATILGTHDHSQYPLMEPGTSLCAVRQLGRGLVYGENVHNVRVTGGGMLDGNGTYRFKMNDPISERRKEDCRPDLCYITYSEGITIESLNFKSPGFWTVVPLSSRNIVMHHLNLDCLNTPNRDGIDPVDCHDMTIYSCNIMAGDDGLCFKSSDPYGCENIDVYDMMIQSLASGIKFGTDTYYSLKNTSVRDCFVKNVNRCGVSLETVDGADVENVTFERISMTDVGAPVYITVGDRKRCPRGENPPRLGRIDGVMFNELRFEHYYPFSHTKHVREVMAIGQYDHARIENVTFKDCYFVLPGGATVTPEEPKVIDARYPEYDRHGASVGHAFTVKYAKNFRVENCEIVLESPDVRPEIAYFNYEK